MRLQKVHQARSIDPETSSQLRDWAQPLLAVMRLRSPGTWWPKVSPALEASLDAAKISAWRHLPFISPPSGKSFMQLQDHGTKDPSTHRACGFLVCSLGGQCNSWSAFSWGCFSVLGAGKRNAQACLWGSQALRALSSRCPWELLPALWRPGWVLLLPPNLLRPELLLLRLSGLLPGNLSLLGLHDGWQGLRSAASQLVQPH